MNLICFQIKVIKQSEVRRTKDVITSSVLFVVSKNHDLNMKQLGVYRKCVLNASQEQKLCLDYNDSIIL